MAAAVAARVDVPPIAAGAPGAGGDAGDGVGAEGPMSARARSVRRVLASRQTNVKSTPMSLLVATQKGAAKSDNGRLRFGYGHEDLDNTHGYYEGHFKLFHRYGKGELRNPETGAHYAGQFQADRFHGHGDNTWPDGSRYVGEWRNGQKHGKGKYTSPEGLTYDGQWEKGLRHGLGTQNYANGDSYRGNWFNGMSSGSGTYTSADGSRFEGTWFEGRHDGVGLLYGTDGTRERLVYNHGYLVKREILTNAPAPDPGSRRDVLCRKVVADQERALMRKPTRLGPSAPSPYLIRRETDGFDLSVPPLKPRTAPAALGQGLGDDSRPSTAMTPLPPLASTAPAVLNLGGGGGGALTARGADGR